MNEMEKYAKEFREEVAELELDHVIKMFVEDYHGHTDSSRQSAMNAIYKTLKMLGFKIDREDFDARIRVRTYDYENWLKNNQYLFEVDDPQDKYVDWKWLKEHEVKDG
jgi:hypothetical protein